LASSIELGDDYSDRPLAWWIDRGEAIYPAIASLAYNMFTIPGMSSECERAISQAKKIVTEER
jgi:hypothetical protein